jgi:hypothetical protein
LDGVTSAIGNRLQSVSRRHRLDAETNARESEVRWECEIPNTEAGYAVEEQ